MNFNSYFYFEFFFIRYSMSKVSPFLKQYVLGYIFLANRNDLCSGYLPVKLCHVGQGTKRKLKNGSED